MMPVKKKAPREVTKAAKKASVGRPTKFRPEFCEQARRLALLGQSDAKIAEFLDIAESTLHLWKIEHREFSECLAAGKEHADAHVADSLYRAALGGGTVTEIREERDSEGNVVTKKTVKELPANVTAQKYWLACRQPHKWRESLRVEEAAPPATVTERANEFVAIMTAARERQRLVLIERGILPPDGGEL